MLIRIGSASLKVQVMIDPATVAFMCVWDGPRTTVLGVVGTHVPL